ncbi:MAG TPA: 1-deoxy-D-xylulose-5-phosphate synthase N-terminal domain-containing protein [Archangium sp.]|uniref:transketolase n=1 Tax=Archangium sp. TaxID=1872627 RepID=UPI002E334B24|nr:1-deoxy-D-xylulose-5-phosphate synthase N-terminal domain-containing protein [Archangium sp.]HEX5753846.1 1-deoxy-D-xylulose-5-phosphate synthase N-terminal domain-containing protein [Archangium sp.]
MTAATTNARVERPSDDALGPLQAHARHIRRLIVRLAATPAGCHVGGSLSLVEILVALLGRVMKLHPQEPLWEGRDHLILSKGHAAAGLYAALSEFGYFDPEELVQNYNAECSHFTGHVSARVPGVDFSTGSLGHGLGLGTGLALGYRLKGLSNRVYVICGDGEMGEGSNWEALQIASHQRLSNLTIIIDRNGGQNDGPTESILSQAALADRLLTFGFDTVEVDGHDLPALLQALEAPATGTAPRAVIAKTQKGAGVPLFKGKGPHYAVFSPEQLRRALVSMGETP